MLPVNGFFGHIQKNHAKSMIMFMGFMVSMHITVATILSIPFPFWNHLPTIFDDPIAYVQTMGVTVSAGILFVFILFYFGHTHFLKHTIGYRPLTAASSPRLHSVTEELSILAGIPTPQLDYIPTPSLNSFASGLTKGSAHIIITQGLLDALDDEELKAVIAHEIAHIKNGDMHMMAVANAAIGSIKLVNFLNPMKFSFVKRIPPIGLIIGLPILLPVLILVIFYSFIMQLTSLIANATRLLISSSREYIADAEAVRLTHNPAALVSALSKIHGRSGLHSNNTIANAMMIDGPTTGKDASHPTIESRISKLATLSGSMIHGAGIRKDTRRQSLSQHGGNAYGSGHYGASGAGATSFSNGFAPVSRMTQSNVRSYIPDSPDYADYQGKTFKTAEPTGILDRVTLENDGEFGLDRNARWAIIGVLCILVPVMHYNKSQRKQAKLQRANSTYVQPVIEQSPVFVALDLKDRGVHTKRLNMNSPYFDFKGQGRRHKTGWLESSSGFLFHDKNRNGQMDGIHELVTADLERSQKSRNLVPLLQFDSNRNGVVNQRDAEFSRLKVWRDFGGDGVFENNEAFTLKSLGITELNVAATDFKKPDGITVASGAKLIKKGNFSRELSDKQKMIRQHVTEGSFDSIILVSFETDLTRYKKFNGEVVTERLPEEDPGAGTGPAGQQKPFSDTIPPSNIAVNIENGISVSSTLKVEKTTVANNKNDAQKPRAKLRGFSSAN